MNPRLVLLLPLAPLVVSVSFAQTSRAPESPVPVVQQPRGGGDQSLLTPNGGEDQRVYGPRQSSLIAPDAAKALSEKFRAAYGQTNSPRIVVLVNRAIGDTPSGLKLTNRKETQSQTTTAEKGAAPASSVQRTAEATYASADTPRPSLADQQTVREIERLFGRVFRNAGAHLADARAAAALLPEQPDVRLTGDDAAKERDALKQFADIVVEVLVSSRNVSVTAISGDSVFTVPDIQATAIRLSDAAIVGQAATSDVLGSGNQTNQIVRQFAVPDITEATAFALMEDMLTGAAK